MRNPRFVVERGRCYTVPRNATAGRLPSQGPGSRRIEMQLSSKDRARFAAYSTPFRIENGRKFRLRDVDPGDTLHLESDDKPRAQEGLERSIECLAALQDRLYAQDRWSVLLIFQAMDAAGQDGAIEHVFSGVNPQGCEVPSFQALSQA